MFDKIILGSGIYGLYSALHCVKKGEKVLILENDDESFARATYINQARIHNGYHYPRSYSTAKKSAKYFEKFNQDFSFAINDDFKKIYSIASNFSWTNAAQFEKFSKNTNVKCEEINSKLYFKEGECEKSFLTEEFTFDAMLIKEFFLKELSTYKNFEIQYNFNLENVFIENNTYILGGKNKQYQSNFVLNATYASINQILDKFGFEKFKIKYEICEIILCTVSENIKNIGITVMDGPFFSLMPFGKTGLHSLTSVTFTPHKTSYDLLPVFDCQKNTELCNSKQLYNCNKCLYKPKSAWTYMSQLAKKFLKDDIKFYYEKSLFSIKPILMSSEIDDSRPTVIRTFSNDPTFVSVLSGKINTIYDLEEIL